MSRTVRHVLILNGHPDPASKGLCHALAEAYTDGARAAGREVQRIDVARLDFPLLRSMAEFEKGTPPPAIAAAQEEIRRADHLVVIFPLWMGDMPAGLKAFFEQTMRPGFAFDYRTRGFPTKRLRGRSARVIVTMGMPALAYRLFYGAHGLKNLRRVVLRGVGFGPVRTTLIGSIGTRSPANIGRALNGVRGFGRRGV
jgi:putative NADPH-quinone reductase